VAYAYADLSTSGTKGDMTRCLIWAGELIDTEKMGDMAGGETLYLRSAGLDDTGVQTTSSLSVSGKLELLAKTLQACMHKHCR
jgi:hypothetical protein